MKSQLDEEIILNMEKLIRAYISACDALGIEQDKEVLSIRDKVLLRWEEDNKQDLIFDYGTLPL